MTNAIARKEMNTAQNGIEIYFLVYPLNGTRETLKNNGFRWNHKKGCWYAKQNLTTESIADICTDTTIEEYKRIAAETGETVKEVRAKEGKETKTAGNKTTKTTKAKTEKVNKYGVKVGDFFSASWGYEQTNNDFFQVIELVGTTSVRVREVHPNIISRDAVGSMAEDRVVDLNNSEIWPPSPYSVFIKDNEKGDLKRLKSYAADGISNPQFYLSSFCDAHYCNGSTKKVYESWYY